MQNVLQLQQGDSHFLNLGPRSDIKGLRKNLQASMFSNWQVFEIQSKDSTSKFYSENINTNPHIFLMKIPDTPTQVLNARSHVTNTPSQCKGQQIRQPKQQVRPIFVYAVLSQGNFLSHIYALFWRTIYRPKNAVEYNK